MKKQLISAGIIICAFLVFYICVGALSTDTDQQEKDNLYAAIQRSIVHCYSIEGAYPESLEYIVENYGVRYDTDKYFVDYQPQGSNILPDVTIIDKTEK
jgi:uncharacterized protein with LGFP repeats